MRAAISAAGTKSGTSFSATERMVERGERIGVDDLAGERGLEHRLLAALDHFLLAGGGGLGGDAGERLVPLAATREVVEHGVGGPARLRRERHGLLRKGQRGVGAALGAGLLVEAGERRDRGLLVGDQGAVVLAGRLHVAERQIGAGLEQLGGVVARQIAAGFAGEDAGAVGVAGLQRDEAVGERRDAEVAAAVAIELGEIARRVEDAAEQAQARITAARPAAIRKAAMPSRGCMR